MPRTTKKSAAAEPAAQETDAPATAKPAKRKSKLVDKGALEAAPAPKKRRAAAKPSAASETRPTRALAATAPPFPVTNHVGVERSLTVFIRREVTRVGVDSVVLGLSGGVDSAVAAALAARALGKAKVLGVMMPY